MSGERPIIQRTQGKIERWHKTLKKCVLLEHYHLPGDLEQSVGEFVAYYNRQTVSRKPEQRNPSRCVLLQG